MAYAHTHSRVSLCMNGAQQLFHCDWNLPIVSTVRYSVLYCMYAQRVLCSS